MLKNEVLREGFRESVPLTEFGRINQPVIEIGAAVYAHNLNTFGKLPQACVCTKSTLDWFAEKQGMYIWKDLNVIQPVAGDEDSKVGRGRF